MEPAAEGIDRGEPDEDVEPAVFAAVDRLLEQGRSFTDITAGAIADEAGITRAAFYGAYGDTTALALRMLDVRTAEVVRVATAWIEQGGGRAELATMMRRMVGGFRQHAALLRTRQELGGSDARVRGFWFARIEGVADVLAHRLRRQVREGATLDPVATASWIAWGTERALTIHIQTRSAASDDAVAEGIAGAIWGAMHQPPA